MAGNEETVAEHLLETAGVLCRMEAESLRKLIDAQPQMTRDFYRLALRLRQQPDAYIRQAIREKFDMDRLVDDLKW